MNRPLTQPLGRLKRDNGIPHLWRWGERPLWEISAALNPEQCLETTVRLPTRTLDGRWCYSGLGDLVEALAAIGTTRTLGLAEMEFLDFLRCFLHISEKDYRLLWDIARAWTEAGLLQRVSDPPLAKRALFAADSAFVSITDGRWCLARRGFGVDADVSKLSAAKQCKKFDLGCAMGSECFTLAAAGFGADRGDGGGID
jgi:hypothetical protein